MARRRPRPGYAFEAPAAASEKPDASEEPAPPPSEVPADAFDELFTHKIAATTIACAEARAAMGWPAREG
mgnify:CR=1 FL=1